ncbi:orotate phosphoribosyltransferase [Dehalococcoidia bacterium]|nr:orotate phosphoribosyltransferase [Dehalococcoidia bacterium]
MSELKNKLLQRVKELNVFKTGNFTLTSGVKSKFYLDGRLLSMDSLASILIGEIFFNEIFKTGVKVIGGPATAAIPIVSSVISVAKLSHNVDLSGFYVRNFSKEHGLSNKIEGNLKNQEDVVVIDDTLTSGQSILSTIKELDLINCNTLKTFTIFDRNSGGKENLEKSGYSNYSIFKYDIDSNSLVI